jgi:hypothetical protein
MGAQKGVSMICRFTLGAGVLLFLGWHVTPVLAEPAPRMSLDGPAGICFAVVVIENRLGVYNRDETLETDHGPVVLHYHTVRGHQPGDDDEIAVVSLPDGVMADPMQMDLPDGDTGRICLMEWLGG